MTLTEHTGRSVDLTSGVIALVTIVRSREASEEPPRTVLARVAPSHSAAPDSLNRRSEPIGERAPRHRPAP